MRILDRSLPHAPEAVYEAKRSLLSIDIETYSSVDLLKSGVYSYAEASDFEILLFACAFDPGSSPGQAPAEVKVYELAAGQALPEDVYNALTDPSVLKTAYNAAFERVCISKHFSLTLPAEQWECTMALAAMCGLPLSLAAVSEALNLKRGKTNGTLLINYFSKPRKVMPVRLQLSMVDMNENRTRNLPADDPVKWNEFVEYCRRDVEAEMEIRQLVKWFPITDDEREMYVLDQRINDAGVLVDRELVANAMELWELTQDANMDKAREMTGLDNPNSAAQLKNWIEGESGVSIKSLNKDAIAEIIERMDFGDNNVREVLSLRKEMAKTSVKKYAAMEKAVCADNRIRGLLQYYGANRTGRWAGRLVQVQNLPRNYLPDLALARRLVKDKRYDDMRLLFGNVPNTLSQLVRTAFVPDDGKIFIVADFGAIEARVIAWLAGEKWRNEVFATHGKIYEASAAQMFGVPIESIGKGSPLRQKGKVAELALGYQGGPGALKAMGALEMGIAEAELQPLVDAWRGANERIVDFWHDAETAAINAVESGFKARLRNIEFLYGKGSMFIRLPSGRLLTYAGARCEIGGRFNRKRIVYKGMNQMTKKWETLETYGGKLVENIVQATARDCLASAMLKIDKAGYKIVMHVHDEVVIECTEDKVDEVCSIMGEPLSWAPGLLLGADGLKCGFYQKD